MTEVDALTAAGTTAANAIIRTIWLLNLPGGLWNCRQASRSNGRQRLCQDPPWLISLCRLACDRDRHHAGASCRRRLRYGSDCIDICKKKKARLTQRLGYKIFLLENNNNNDIGWDSLAR
jgi:hypothetical protein